MDMTSVPAPEIPLRGHLCLAVHQAAHAFTAIYRPLLDPFGLTYPQYLVLVALWERAAAAEEPPGVKDLGEQLQLDSGTLSPLLARLEAAGHVRRARDTADGRAVRVHLTDSGLRLRTELAAVPRTVARCTDLAGDDALRLLTDLQRLTERLRAAAQA
jgi:MarR family transcriptional regulator, organic hydroperoxide resistance regulator